MVTFHDTTKENAWRAEVQDFLYRELPTGWKKGMDRTRWLAKLKERGWYAPGWPKEFGGANLSPMEQFILNEELAARRAPRADGIALGMAGPTIITYGTEEQKRRLLPEMLDPAVRWCQLYSEPGAGSDLASVTTSARRDGDFWLVTGQKIWTSEAHKSKRGVLLARSDPAAPKHKGLTYFVVDMDSPGIDIRPLVNLANEHRFNEVFFDEVRVPHENVVGEVNRGWYVGATTLNFERSSIGSAVGLRQQVEDLIELTRDLPAPLDGNARTELAERFIETEVATLLSYRVVSLQNLGHIPSHESSMVKLYTSELTQRIASTGTRVLGLYGELMPDSHAQLRKSGYGIRYLLSVSATIAGGTSEIQRTLLATRGLGLPRS